MYTSDPRDRGYPTEKAWQEFRAAYSASRLLGWLLKELDPSYLRDLRERLTWAIVQGEGAKDEGDDDPGVDLEGSGGWPGVFTGLDEIIALEQQLFPFGESQSDFGDFARAHALIGLHSALETYSSSLGCRGRRLPEAIEKHLKARTVSFDSALYSDLCVLDASRHVYVHNRGVVDEAYLRAVRHSPLQLGERRPVTETELETFASTVWRIAVILRGAQSGPTPGA